MQNVGNYIMIAQLSIKSFVYGFLKKWTNPGLIFVYFRSFQTNIATFFTTNRCEKMSCPSSLQLRDSNSQLSEHEPLPITTRPGLPPILFMVSFSLYNAIVGKNCFAKCASAAHCSCTKRRPVSPVSLTAPTRDFQS